MFFKKEREELKNIRAEIQAVRSLLEKIRVDASAAHSYAKCSARSIEAHSLAASNAYAKLEQGIEDLNTVIEGERRSLEDAPTLDRIVDEMMNGVKINE